MSRAVLAIVIAVGVHVVLALGLVAVMHLSSNREISDAELDLSSVELSLSDREAEAPPVQQVPLAPTPPPEPAYEPETVRPPDSVGFAPLLVVPPEVASVDLPAPEPEAVVTLDLPPTEVVPEPERDEPPEEDKPVEEDRPTERPVEATDEEAKSEPSAPPPEASAPAAPTPAPQQARVDVPPAPKQTIKPKYPKESRQRGEEGDVLVEVDVTDRGSVTSVRVVRSSGFPALDAAAKKAAQKAKFTPAKAAGKSVPTTARLTLSFRLKK